MPLAQAPFYAINKDWPLLFNLQIYLIIKPVVVCIVLSIFWVKVGFNDQSDYSPTRPTYDVLTSTNTAPSGSSDSGSVGLSSFTNAAIIIGQIIVVTVVIVFFFRKGWIKVLIGFFMIVVMFLLGFMTYLLLLNLIQIFYIPLDYITLSVALWNFVIVGLVSIFWKGPLWLQQAYLTVLSSLMAFSLTGLEQWTTWILLGLLAVWDLIAVLCPFGPLRLLIESSRTQQREVPALLYSVNAVWFMLASPSHISHSFTTPDNIALPDIHHHPATTSSQSLNSLEHSRYPSSTTSSSAPLYQYHHSDHGISTTDTTTHQNGHGFYRLQGNNRSAGITTGIELETMDARPRSVDQRRSQDLPVPPTTNSLVDEEDTERSGLKLGLGDFVFYSVLVARAAMYDWITTVCCTIAVLTGLTTTIFLLAIFKKALPALPISIAFGILFYFVAKTVLVPYVAAVCVFGMVGI
ncbi:Presenilin-domain-containing protein [Chlamydoabsidia padenii]|nr:Presenilin-domain-containing protein [Chlamydoabsidia padenii]